MERILVILNRVETAQSVLVTAGRLHARLANSRLDVLHARPEIDPSFMPTEEVWAEDRGRRFNTERDVLLHALETAVTEWRAKEPTPVHQSSGEPMRVVTGKIEDTIRTEAAACDLVVLGSAGTSHEFEAKETIETSLFNAAAPTLLVPESIPNSCGRRVAVAWERSQAADEAVDAALPLLLSADEVVLLIAEEGHQRATLPIGLLQCLEQGKIPTKIVRFRLNGREIGTALLDEAQVAHADLLVMGAFTHNRVMEALFGGATRQILAGASLPVLMHH